METPYEVIAHWTFYSVSEVQKTGEGGESTRTASAREDSVYRATLIERADAVLVDTEDGLSGLERAPLGEPVLRAWAGRTG